MKFRKIWVAPAMVAVGALALAAGFGVGQSIDGAKAGEPEAQIAGKKRMGTPTRPGTFPQPRVGRALQWVCTTKFKATPSSIKLTPPQQTKLYTCKLAKAQCPGGYVHDYNQYTAAPNGFKYACWKAVAPKCPSGYMLDASQNKLYPSGLRFYCLKAIYPKCPKGYKVANVKKVGAGFSYECFVAQVPK